MIREFIGTGTWDDATKKLSLVCDGSCEEAAVTVFHELVHKGQRADLGVAEAELDAYCEETELAIDCDKLEPEPKFVRRLNGDTEVDKDAIKEHVSKSYPSVAAGGEVVVGMDEDGDTIVEDTRTGVQRTRKPKDGDSYPGPKVTKGMKRVPKTTWKCPRLF